jgi:hypothetical protein
MAYLSVAGQKRKEICQLPLYATFLDLAIPNSVALSMSILSTSQQCLALTMWIQSAPFSVSFGKQMQDPSRGMACKIEFLMKQARNYISGLDITKTTSLLHSSKIRGSTKALGAGLDFFRRQTDIEKKHEIRL